MQRIISATFQNPTARALVLIALVLPISFYLGTSPVRRGFLYYAGVFAPSAVAAIAAGLWTWSWKWFWIMLVVCGALTMIIQMLVYLFR
jgi:hypothetical protein